jgi:hypothetical protein
MQAPAHLRPGEPPDDPHRKEGTRLLFKLSHLDAWIEGGGAT